MPRAAAGKTNRLTWICRQRVKGIFDCQVGKVPEGDILPSILLVPGGKPAKLEDMILAEPSVWLRSHATMDDGNIVEREEGMQVGRLGCALRELRRQTPQLFKDGKVLVWLQPEATEDEVICSFLSEQAGNEANQCIMQVDMFKGEHTAKVRERNSLPPQVKHCIGMHQTSKRQLTDIIFARIGKLRQAQ